MEDLEFYRRRLADELAAAQSCDDPHVRRIHVEMAEAYRMKVERLSCTGDRVRPATGNR